MSLHYHPCNAKACEPSGKSVAELVAEERERIVAWLRKQRGWVTMRMSDGYSSTTALEPSDFADAIECGAHLEEK